MTQSKEFQNALDFITSKYPASRVVLIKDRPGSAEESGAMQFVVILGVEPRRAEARNFSADLQHRCEEPAQVSFMSQQDFEAGKAQVGRLAYVVEKYGETVHPPAVPPLFP